MGGCDIVTEMFESGELADALGASRQPEVEPDPPATEPPPLQIDNLQR